jgi:hypothetical protein
VSGWRFRPIERAEVWKTAAVFPLYDAGNIGMQMRKIWGVMLDEDFDPRAIADTKPMRFKKSMEGVGTLVSREEPASTAAPGKPPRAAPRRARRG